MRARRWISLLVLLLLLRVAQPASAMFPDDSQPVFPQIGPTLTTQAGPTTPSPSPYLCSFTPAIDPLVAGTTLAAYTGWISKMSGNEAWTVGDHTLTIVTRDSFALFPDNGTYTAFNLLRDQLLQWYPSSQLKEESYTYSSAVWKNLILTIEGSQEPENIVMLTAHFDDTPASGAAPGADDNASGSATLLEAARVLAGHTFPRTVKIVWFTGEEQGKIGSAAYAAAHLPELSRVQGVINLDIYAYDNDNDHCFEMHVGTLPASDQVGQCLAQAVQMYQPDLRYDYLNTSNVSHNSDHDSFWKEDVGAVFIGENLYAWTSPNGCGSTADRNIYWHTVQDTLATINFDMAYPIHRSAMAAFFAMANASANPYKVYFPLVPHLAP